MRLYFKKHHLSSIVDTNGDVNLIPDTCPLCHHAGTLIVISGYLNVDGGMSGHSSKKLQVVLQCPRNTCKSYSIAYYRPISSDYTGFLYESQRPVNHTAHAFTDTISGISTEFVDIYNQASQAESLGLDKIAGVGYRKALEFLIKDYLINKIPDNAESIKSKFLGNCINEDVTDANIKNVCSRAVWLGNDETHYVRVWEHKDVTDLKKVIQLAVHWIESEVLTAKLIEEMPTTSRG